jgi:hypothetical protein
LHYFFTQTFFASSHFMSFVFSQSALVFGASAAKAGGGDGEQKSGDDGCAQNL